MTVANTNVSSSYNCNGATREFDLGFAFDSNLSNISIVVKHADGTSTNVTANYEIESGVLTYPTVESELDPLPQGDVITITRVTPLTQTINLVQQGPLDAETLESGYDKATLQIQEISGKKQDKLTAGDNIVITEDGKISASGQVSGNVNWGNILGTLSNQTDLQTALNAKQATISDLNTIRSGAAAGATALQSTDITSTYSATGTDAVNGTAVASAISDKADTNLSNLTSTGESHFDSTYVKLKSGVTQENTNFVVETYINGTSWYRIWSDGWCEQGGHIVVENGGQTQSVIFLKTFANDNYALTFAPFASGSNVAEANFRCSASSASGCTFYNNAATVVTYRWVACGYLA